MQSATAKEPIEKHVVLVGAGNAHLVFLRRWRMRPVRGVAVTLVNETAVIPYSAMVPGHLAGDYTWDEITIDLVRWCQTVQVACCRAGDGPQSWKPPGSLCRPSAVDL